MPARLYFLARHVGGGEIDLLDVEGDGDVCWTELKLRLRDGGGEGKYGETDSGDSRPRSAQISART